MGCDGTLKARVKTFCKSSFSILGSIFHMILQSLHRIFKHEPCSTFIFLIPKGIPTSFIKKIVLLNRVNDFLFYSLSLLVILYSIESFSPNCRSCMHTLHLNPATKNTISSEFHIGPM